MSRKYYEVNTLIEVGGYFGRIYKVDKTGYYTYFVKFYDSDLTNTWFCSRRINLVPLKEKAFFKNERRLCIR